MVKACVLVDAQTDALSTSVNLTVKSCVDPMTLWYMLKLPAPVHPCDSRSGKNLKDPEVKNATNVAILQ